MRDLQWGTLAYLHDELVKQEDLRKRQRQTSHKRLYKNQLQRIIQEKNQYLRNSIAINRRRDNQPYKSLDNEGGAQQQKRARLTRESYLFNNDAANHQKLRVKSQIQEEKMIHKEKYRKSDTERSEQMEKKNLEKERLRKELSQAYERQMASSQSRKSLEKLQNHQFEKLAQQIQDKRQAERMNHINRIKYGYSQNPETYRTIQHIYNQRQQLKQVFLRKIETQRNNDSQSQLRRNHQIKEASQYNKNNFKYQSLQRKQQILKEKEEQNHKLITIQRELKCQQQRERQRKEEQAKVLQRQLNGQIDQANKNKMSLKVMNPDEHRLNKSYLKLIQPISIPGLYKDYKDIKRDEIIDNFLTNKKYSSSPSSPFWSDQK